MYRRWSKKKLSLRGQRFKKTEIKDEKIDNSWNWRHVKINEIDTRKDRQINRKKKRLKDKGGGA